jgi:hypothetical protein
MVMVMGPGALDEALGEGPGAAAGVDSGLGVISNQL